MRSPFPTLCPPFRSHRLSTPRLLGVRGDTGTIPNLDRGVSGEGCWVVGVVVLTVRGEGDGEEDGIGMGVTSLDASMLPHPNLSTTDRRRCGKAGLRSIALNPTCDGVVLQESYKDVTRVDCARSILKDCTRLGSSYERVLTSVQLVRS
jgi:hypothetical protein